MKSDNVSNSDKMIYQVPYWKDLDVKFIQALNVYILMLNLLIKTVSIIIYCLLTKLYDFFLSFVIKKLRSLNLSRNFEMSCFCLILKSYLNHNINFQVYIYLLRQNIQNYQRMFRFEKGTFRHTIFIN